MTVGHFQGHKADDSVAFGKTCCITTDARPSGQAYVFGTICATALWVLKTQTFHFKGQLNYTQDKIKIQPLDK